MHIPNITQAQAGRQWHKCDLSSTGGHFGSMQMCSAHLSEYTQTHSQLLAHEQTGGHVLCHNRFDLQRLAYINQLYDHALSARSATERGFYC